MYRLKINNENQYTEKVVYVRKQDNGVIVICKNGEQAHGFLSADGSTIYTFADSPIAADYEQGEVQQISLDEFAKEQREPLEENVQTLTDCILEMSQVIYS